MMQQLVGGGDPSSPLEVDWDALSVTSTEQTEYPEEGPTGWASGRDYVLHFAFPVLKPQSTVMLH